MEWNEMKSNDKIKYNNQVKNITRVLNKSYIKIISIKAYNLQGETF